MAAAGTACEHNLVNIWYIRKTMKVTVNIPEDNAKELAIVIKKVGIKDYESLFLNYVREVIMAARIEAAANKSRQEVINKSTDLDILIPERKPISQKRH